jgi:hypothetical protein
MVAPFNLRALILRLSLPGRIQRLDLHPAEHFVERNTLTFRVLAPGLTCQHYGGCRVLPI